MTTCVLSCRRPIHSGLLCGWHARELGQLLDPQNTGSVFDPVRPDDARVLPSIPVLYGWLDARFGRSGDPGPVGVFRSTPPARLQVLALRDPRTRADGAGVDDHEQAPPWSILSTLALICDRVDRRDLDNRPEPRPAQPVTVGSLSGWLYARREWLAAQTWVDDTWADLKALQSQLRAAWGDPAMTPVGPCVQLVDATGRGQGRRAEGPERRCGVPLFFPEQPPKAPDEPVQLPALRCGACGWTYTGVDLVRLGRERDQRQREEAS